MEEDERHAEQARLEKIKWEKELEKLKQKCYDAYKRKLKEDLQRKYKRKKN